MSRPSVIWPALLVIALSCSGAETTEETAEATEGAEAEVTEGPEVEEEEKEEVEERERLSAEERREAVLERQREERERDGPGATEPEPELEQEPEPHSAGEMAQEDAAVALEKVARKIVDRWRAGSDDFSDLDAQLRKEGEQLQARYAPLEYEGTSSPVNDWRYAVVWMTRYGIPGSEERGWLPQNLMAPFNRVGIEGVPSAPSSGPHRVADVTAPTDTVAPGTYEAFDVEGCYWERLDNAGGIIDNNFVNAAPRVEVTISSSDYAFNSERCGSWIEVQG